MQRAVVAQIFKCAIYLQLLVYICQRIHYRHRPFPTCAFLRWFDSKQADKNLNKYLKTSLCKKGYGLVYALDFALKDRKETLAGKSITISGSGNVAQFAAEKCLHLGGTVLTFSDSAGTIYEVSLTQITQAAVNTIFFETLKKRKHDTRGLLSKINAGGETVWLSTKYRLCLTTKLGFRTVNRSCFRHQAICLSLTFVNSSSRANR